MILIDIFKRKRKLEPLFKKCWQRIGDEIIYPEIVEEEPVQKLVYYGLLSYATIYESALVVGMEPSTGHYLARMQIGKYKLGDDVTEVVESTFSGLETDDAAAYADFFLGQVNLIVNIISEGEGEITSLLKELADGYRPAEWS